MPRSAQLDAWVKAVRERDNRWGRAPQSLMIKQDLSQGFVSYVPSVQGVPQPRS